MNRFEKGTVVDGALLKAKGLIENYHRPFKILADGELKKPLTIKVKSISKSAEEKIIKAGGKVEIIISGSQDNTERSKDKKPKK